MLCEGPDSSRRIILDDPDPNKVGRSLSDDIKQHVIAFYELEEYSRICPGKKEFVVVRDGGLKSHKQKQLLLLNLHELYVAYKAKYLNNKLASPSFVSCDLHGACQLRQLVCIMCVCVSHTKMP